MIRFQYLGSIEPRSSQITIIDIPAVTRDVAAPPQAKFALEIEDGRFKVDVETERFDAVIADSLFVDALDYVRGVIETFGFADGVPYSANIDTIVEPGGTERLVVLGDREMAKLCTAYTEHSADAVLELVLTNNDLARVLSDAMRTLSQPHYSPISCGRIAEGLARLVGGNDRRAAWPALRDALNVEEAYLKLLTEHSKAPRHGDNVAVAGAVTRELSIRAWTLIDRYFHYRLGGGKALDRQRFPRLQNR